MKSRASLKVRQLALNSRKQSQCERGRFQVSMWEVGHKMPLNLLLSKNQFARSTKGTPKCHCGVIYEFALMEKHALQQKPWPSLHCICCFSAKIGSTRRSD